MTLLFVLFKSALRLTVSAGLMSSFLFSITALADEGSVHGLYTEALKFSDAMAVDAQTLRLSEGDYFFEKSESYYAKLLKVRGAIHADKAKIRQIDNWKNKLSRDLAENLSDLSDSYSAVSAYKARQDVIGVKPKLRAVCDALIAEAKPIIDKQKEILARTHIYSDKQEAEMEPHSLALKNKVTHYNLLLDNEMIQYRIIAGKYDKRRERLGKHLWRFVHAYEGLENKKELEIVKAALAHSAGLPGQSYQPATAWVFHDTHIYTSTAECPMHIGAFPYVAKIPNKKDYLSNYITRPYEEFDEQEQFLPLPPRGGDSPLERAAIALSHRQVQRFKIDDAMQDVGQKLQIKNTIVRDVSITQASLAEAISDVGALLSSSRPERDLQSDRDLAQQFLDMVLKESEDARHAVVKEQQAIAEDDQVRVKNVGLGQFEKAEPGSSQKTVAAWVAEFERSKLTFIRNREILEKQQKVYSRRPTAHGLEVYENRKAQIKEILKFEAEINANIAAVRKAGAGEPADRTKLEAAETAAKVAAAIVQQARNDLQKSQDVLDRRQSTGALMHLRTDILTPIKASQSSWRKSANPDVLAALERIDFSAAETIDATASYEGLTKALDAMKQANEAILSQIEEERAALTALVGRFRALDMKKRMVLETLSSTKRAAVSLVQKALPASGYKEDSELMQLLEQYQTNLKDMQSILQQGSALLAQPETLVGYMDSVNAIYNTGVSVELGELGKRMSAANEAVGHMIGATETLQSKVSNIQTLTKALTPPSSDSPAAGFKHIQDVLDVAKIGLESVPVIGSISGVYVDYMSGSVRTISKKAEFIRATTFNKMINEGNYNPPERHLLTLSEINNRTWDHAVFTRWAKTGGNDVIEGLQARRILYLLGPRTIGQACNQSITKNSSDPYGKKTCTQQGRIK